MPPAGADLYQVEGQQVPGYDAPGYEAQTFGPPGYDAPPVYDTPGYPPAGAGFAPAPFPPGEQPFGPEDDDFYDDAAPNRRRVGIIAIAAVFALAVIGTAGAFGYRALFGSSSSTTPPPVIKADTAPSKIVPASAGKDAQANKMITDRVGAGGQGEKLVSREEQPMAVTTQRPANIVFPQAQGPNGQAAPALGSGVIGTEPKKVRTIPIRPDQQTGSMIETPMSAPPQPATPEPPQARVAPVTQPTRVTEAPRAEPAPRPVAPRPVAPRPVAPVRHVTAPARSNAPLSLSPNAAPARVAALAPRRTTCRGRKQRRLWRPGLLAAERSGRRGGVSFPAGQVPERAWRPSAAHQARRSRRQGCLLPRHGRPLWEFRRGGPTVFQPEIGRRKLLHPEVLTLITLLSTLAGANPRANGSARIHHGIGGFDDLRRRAGVFA